MKITVPRGKNVVLRSGGIEPPSNAWKASMLTITPRTRLDWINLVGLTRRD